MDITIKTFDAEQYDGDFPFSYDTRLTDVISWFQQKLEEIPSEYRGSAVCEISSTGGYESSHYATIRIEYTRPETAEECADRKAAERSRAEECKQRDIAKAKAILAQYGE